MADAHNAAKFESFDASDYHVGIAVGLFNSHITGPMRDLVVETLINDYNVPESQITLIELAGAADMPVALEALARKDEIDCLVSLACIIRGSTAHFDYVAKVVTEAVKDVQIKHCKPVAFGVLTVENEDQAVERIPHAAGYTHAALHATKAIRAIS